MYFSVVDTLESFVWKLVAAGTLIFSWILAITLFSKIYRLHKDGIDWAFSKEHSSGIIFGKKFGQMYISSLEAREGHICILGPSGSGKTSGLLITNLRNWRGTSFSIDIAGDIEKNVHQAKKLIYQPENLNSTPYNVFYAIDIMEQDADKYEAIEKLAYLLMPELPPRESSASAKFYNQEGRKILTAALLAGYGQGKDFIEICKWVMTSSYQQLFHEIDQSGNELAIQYINSFSGALSENTSGCKQAADLAIKLFATNEYVMNSIRRPKRGEASFDPGKIEIYNVFFVVSDAKLDVYAPLVHLVVAQVLEYFSVRSDEMKQSILLCIDEAASFGKLELTAALRKLRKRRIRIITATQSLNDWIMIYGEAETKAMLGNYAYKVILGANDYETAEFWAKSIGHKKSTRRSFQEGDKGGKVIHTEIKEFAYEPEELGRLRNKLILLYPGGYMMLRKNYYFK